MIDLDKIISRKRLCNGYSAPLPNPFTDKEKAEIKKRLPALRELLRNKLTNRNDDIHFYIDKRFMSDDSVMKRMQSVESKVTIPLDEFIIDALLDCAESDWYYNFEKEW